MTRTPTRTDTPRATTPRITSVTSRENAALVRTRKLVADPAQARRDGVCWIEGDHLLRAARAAGFLPRDVFVVDDAWSRGDLHDLVDGVDAVHVLPQRLMTSISTLESPPSVAAWIDRPAPGAMDTRARTVVLDRLQDPGNVGSILRSAAAFGYTQVLALQGTVAIWSAKVVRAAMGAHFSLRLHEGVEPRALWTLELPLSWARSLCPPTRDGSSATKGRVPTRCCCRVANACCASVSRAARNP
jgi:RNA methyltransferase, TrmH family